jgi:hypothetical protein
MARKKKPAPGKPELVLVKGQTLGVEDIVAMYEALTGRPATPEEIERVKAGQGGSKTKDRETECLWCNF